MYGEDFRDVAGGLLINKMNLSNLKFGSTSPGSDIFSNGQWEPQQFLLTSMWQVN